MTDHWIDAVPLQHPHLEEWRDAKRGVQFLHQETNFLVFGAVDDLWIEKNGDVVVVDYKATSSERSVSIEGEWKKSYKRQLEVYQWLLRKNGLPVSNIGYFVYVNADRNKPSFEGRLDFSTTLLSYQGDDSWIEDALLEAHLCLQREQAPMANAGCEWCMYREAVRGVENI